MNNAELTIRKTTRADLAAVDALLARSYPVLLAPDYPPSVLVTALPLLARAQPGLLASGRYFLAERDGQVLGAGGYSGQAPQGRRRKNVAHIRHLVTDHRATRQGIGRALMTNVMAAAIAEGAKYFDCLSTRTAVPFYASLGFERGENVEIELRPGITFPAVQMWFRA